MEHMDIMGYSHRFVLGLLPGSHGDIMGYQTIETTETTTCYLGLPENRFIHSIAILEGRMMRNLADFGFSRFSPNFSQKQ